MVRHAILEGRKHLVVPVVMMVEGVHNGSAGPIFHPAEELGRYAAAWNGIPVTIGHPTDNGMPVSANQPEVLEKAAVGKIFNTRLVDKKLKAEAWLDIELLKRKAPVALSYLKQGKPIEVSVGVFADEEEKEGVWNNEKYRAIARNHRPDHLALLLDAKGACSWEDGCGVRAYSEEGGDDGLITNKLKYNGTESTPWSAPDLKDFGVDGRWEDLSQQERARIASHYLIGDANAKSFAELKLPVVNPKTGKLNERALRAVISGRGAQVKGVSPEVLRRARRTAYRLLNEEFDAGLEIPEGLQEQLWAIHAELEELKEKLKGGVMAMADKNDKKGGCNCPEKIKLLTQGEGALFTADDCEWLNNLPEERIDQYLEVQEKMRKKEGDVQTNKDKEVTKEEAIQVLREQLQDPQKFLELLPSEHREQMQYGLNLYKEKKAELVESILNHSKAFTKEELETKSMDELNKIASLIPAVTDYSVKGGAGKNHTPTDVEILPPAGVELKN